MCDKRRLRFSRPASSPLRTAVGNPGAASLFFEPGDQHRGALGIGPVARFAQPVDDEPGGKAGAEDILQRAVVVALLPRLPGEGDVIVGVRRHIAVRQRDKAWMLRGEHEDPALAEQRVHRKKQRCDVGDVHHGHVAHRLCERALPPQRQQARTVRGVGHAELDAARLARPALSGQRHHRLAVIEGEHGGALLRQIGGIIAVAAGGIYVPTDFDTKEKALSGAKAAEKGLK